MPGIKYEGKIGMGMENVPWAMFGLNHMLSF
jgi:hypothetical protein